MTNQINGLQGRNNKRMPPPVPRHHSLERSSARSCNPTVLKISEAVKSVNHLPEKIKGNFVSEVSN